MRRLKIRSVERGYVSRWMPNFCDKLLPRAKFHWNQPIGCWVMAKKDFQYGGRPPFWILEIFIFVHVTVVEYQKNLLLSTKFHFISQCVVINRMIFRWHMAIWRFSRWRPTTILNFRSSDKRLCIKQHWPHCSHRSCLVRRRVHTYFSLYWRRLLRWSFELQRRRNRWLQIPWTWRSKTK